MSVALQAMFAPVQLLPLQQGCPTPPQAKQVLTVAVRLQESPVLQVVELQQASPAAPQCWQKLETLQETFAPVHAGGRAQQGSPGLPQMGA